MSRDNSANIVISIQQTPQRNSASGSVQFSAAATVDDANDALRNAGFDVAHVADGFERKLFNWTPHPGGRHFEFFVSDSVLTQQQAQQPQATAQPQPTETAP